MSFTWTHLFWVTTKMHGRGVDVEAVAQGAVGLDLIAAGAGGVEDKGQAAVVGLEPGRVKRARSSLLAM